MKMAIIGGAGVRVPLVTNGLLRHGSSLSIDELALFDTDAHRLEIVARITEAMIGRLGGSLRVTRPRALEEAVDGCHFVVSSVRVGGLAGRIADERIALGQGVPGQETVGPGGFALALRTIPSLVEYVRRIRQAAPRAWIINFTNPVGIMAEAFIQEGISDRCIGVCDTPREQYLHIADALGIPLETASFDYIGLNHLGWIRSVLVDGLDRMGALLASDEALDRAYPRPLFPKHFLRELGLLPTEYLYYYYYPGEAVRRTEASANTRGLLIQQLTRRLLQSVAEAGTDQARIMSAYDSYLAHRNASYMAIETDGASDAVRLEAARDSLYQSAVGYERIALDVMTAMHANEPKVMPLNVPNCGAVRDLSPETAVEVPCVIDGNGPRPLATGSLPGSIRTLLVQVKEYERLTVRAALGGSRALALDALAANPLVRSRELAATLLDEYRNAHSPGLDYLV